MFDGDPTASWALVYVDGEDVAAEIQRTEFDVTGRLECDLGPRTAWRRLPRGDGSNGKLVR